MSQQALNSAKSLFEAYRAALDTLDDEIGAPFVMRGCARLIISPHAMRGMLWLFPAPQTRF